MVEAEIMFDNQRDIQYGRDNINPVCELEKVCLIGLNLEPLKIGKVKCCDKNHCSRELECDTVLIFWRYVYVVGEVDHTRDCLQNERHEYEIEHFDV